MLNVENKNTWRYVSDENMILTHGLWQEEHKGLKYCGAEDCIEQTYHAFIAYNNDIFIKGIENCWKKVEYKSWIMKKLFKYKYKPQRYPITYEGMTEMSRDHVIYSILAFYYSSMSLNKLKDYINHLSFFIGGKLGKTMTLSLWLWLKLISNNKIGLLYYPVQLFEIYINYLWNEFIEKIIGINLYKEQDIEKFTLIPKKDKPKIITFFRDLLYPTFALKLVANQTTILPNNWFIRKIRKYGLKMTPDKNYVIRCLFKEFINSEEFSKIYNLTPIYGERWSNMLNPYYNDRDARRILDLPAFKNKKDILFKENYVDKDYALKLLILP